MSQSETVIEIRNLSKVYRDFWGRPKVRALNALSLDIKKGEVFGLLGPNGSGKTTTLKLLLGLLFPTEGEVKVLGKSAADVSKNERIGYLPEESYLYRFLNAYETLDFYGRLFDMTAAQRKERSEKLLDLVKLAPQSRRRQLKEYSKGMQRRIGVAQALINDPDLVMLDEPMAGVNPALKQSLNEHIRGLRDDGMTVLFVEHDMDMVHDISDWVIVMAEGQIIAEGSPNQISANPAVIDAYLGAHQGKSLLEDL